MYVKMIRARSLIFLIVIAHNLMNIASENHKTAATASKDNSACDESLNRTLAFVFLIHRHGDRAPIITYPEDPHKNYPWPRGLGQLSNLGVSRSYRLGLWIRDRYGDFIRKYYVPNEIRMDSSDEDRCLMSGQSVLAGLYSPAHSADIWNSSLSLAVPKPVHTRPAELDNFIALRKPCKAFSEYSKYFWNTSNTFIIKDMCERFQYVFDIVTKHTRFNLTCGPELDFWILIVVYDSCKIQRMNGLNCSDWFDPIYNAMDDMYGWYLYVQVGHSNLAKRLAVGPLVGVMMSDFDAVKYRPGTAKTQKIHIISAHDITIVCWRRAFGIYDGLEPENAETLIFELWKGSDANDYHVKVLYKNGVEHKPTPLHLPDCPCPCSLDTFRNITKTMVPDDWEQECDKPVPAFSKDTNIQHFVSPRKIAHP